MRIEWSFSDGKILMQTDGNLPKINSIVKVKINSFLRKFIVESSCIMLQISDQEILAFDLTSTELEDKWFELEDKVNKKGGTMGNVDWNCGIVSIYSQIGEVVLREVR